VGPSIDTRRSRRPNGDKTADATRHCMRVLVVMEIKRLARSNIVFQNLEEAYDRRAAEFVTTLVQCGALRILICGVDNETMAK